MSIVGITTANPRSTIAPLPRGAVSFLSDALDEEELLARVGEDPAFVAELMKRYELRTLAIARRYRGKGVPSEDLHQVALIALLKAIRRFDPSRGSLESFSAVTISGELKRHLRDHVWSVHVPRGLKERSGTVARTAEILTQMSGRVPTASDIAASLGDLSTADVAEAMSAVYGYTAMSLDQSEVGPLLADTLTQSDDSFEDSDRRHEVTEALLSLNERERLIVYLRFYEDQTQSQIAARVGVSQMQVSRLLARSLSALSRILDSDA